MPDNEQKMKIFIDELLKVNPDLIRNDIEHGFKEADKDKDLFSLKMAIFNSMDRYLEIKLSESKKNKLIKA